MRHRRRFLISIIASLFLAGFAVATPVYAAGDSLIKNSLFNEPVQKISSYFEPEIIFASVEPKKVVPGDIMTITAEIKDNLGIKSVTADMGGIETIELKQGEGNIYRGIWENRWQVHGTEAREYVTIIIVTNIFGKTVTKEIKWRDPTTDNVGGWAWSENIGWVSFSN